MFVVNIMCNIEMDVCIFVVIIISVFSWGGLEIIYFLLNIVLVFKFLECIFLKVVSYLVF